MADNEPQKKQHEATYLVGVETGAEFLARLEREQQQKTQEPQEAPKDQ